MIKKLDTLILRTFMGPFVVTLFISLFALDMQFFWVYMDDFIGKGLGPWLIAQELIYMSATLVPLALPLAILLSSIMCFGNMGEYYELVAIKSAGISLLRFMRPLVVFIVIVAGLGFLFNNNVIPIANLKALSLLYDLRNSKPALNIHAGQFNNDIDGYSIRIGEKDKDGRSIRHIVIYDHTSGTGNDKVVLADHGIMLPSADKHYLIFRLQDGWRYQEGNFNSRNYYGTQQHNEQIRMHFKQWDKVFDLSGFSMTRTKEGLFKDAWQMMDVQQLGVMIDSIKRDERRNIARNETFVMPYYTTVKANSQYKDLTAALARKAPAPLRTFKKGFIEIVPDSMRSKVVLGATANVRNLLSQYGLSAVEDQNYQKRLRDHSVAWHQKFTLSFACILLFLIGAPLGAIIRKGGLGMPLVVAVAFFLLYYIISITGEKLASTGKLPVWAGMWMSTAMLLPIATLLIQQARNDSQLFSKEWYTRFWRKTGGKLFAKLQKRQVAGS